MPVTITDVVLRDGLQDEDVLVATADKLTITDALVAAGIRQIEAVSFVSPTRVPQMADADTLIDRLQPYRAITQISALALNAKGIHRAVAAGVDVVHIAASASSAHSQANAGKSAAQALEDLSQAVASYPKQRFLGGIATAFVCPFEGIISPARLVEVAEQFAAMGIHTLGLADTLGTATTEHVLTAVSAVREALPDITIGLHLHNADGQALTTALHAARNLGIEHFDSAVGGYGGCPFAPGAHGNLATEELVAHFHSHDVDTGIDLQQLATAATTVKRILADSPQLPEE
ncbi:hydroxymethylglutaryl-CoA lyase [Rhodococcus erythropolis]|uniref:hydroxymethylglutaryl-CoA lyase n=1 Tax=Rhodococcus erythropolis TaxID=1833 RepID=UPI0021696789|nr:hydroxymethylglutaryl-CoA lyase [Rhodococcus erythropolis]MCS4257851.1 hydroxymethylglutaryl-CoA lyase [Rhodococcus erythropolis]MCW2425155.1 hydroxymethylglutaryl-CoA lyase [Rhodococcus erythropolis]